MPLTFGAVGDVIAVASIVKKILDALDSSRGAAPEYRELKRELYKLERGLLEVEHLIRESKDTTELTELCVSAGDCIADCRTTVDGLLKKTKKYGKALAEGSTSNVVSRSAMQLRWTLLDKDEVVKSRNQISAHTACLNMLLCSANVKLMELRQQQLATSISQSHVATVDLLRSQGTTLMEIKEQLDEKNAIMVRQENSLASIRSALAQHTVIVQRQEAYLVDMHANICARWSIITYAHELTKELPTHLRHAKWEIYLVSDILGTAMILLIFRRRLRRMNLELIGFSSASTGREAMAFFQFAIPIGIIYGVISFAMYLLVSHVLDPVPRRHRQDRAKWKDNKKRLERALRLFAIGVKEALRMSASSPASEKFVRAEIAAAKPRDHCVPVKCT